MFDRYFTFLAGFGFTQLNCKGRLVILEGYSTEEEAGQIREWEQEWNKRRITMASHQFARGSCMDRGAHEVVSEKGLAARCISLFTK